MSYPRYPRWFSYSGFSHLPNGAFERDVLIISGYLKQENFTFTDFTIQARFK